MKTKTATMLGGALVLAMGVGGAAWAHGPKGEGRHGDGPRGGMERMLEEFDANSDGSITKAEVEAATTERFNAADTDGDGFLSADELAAQAEADRADRMAKRSARMVEHLDEDGDGKLSAEEMAARGPVDMFDRLDEDEDGVLTQDELADARGMMRGGRGDHDHKRGGKHGFWGRGDH